MRDPASGKARLRLGLSAAAALSVLFISLICPASRGANPPEQVTAKQRQELEKTGSELDRAG
jgi:hypothetical protein